LESLLLSSNDLLNDIGYCFIKNPEATSDCERLVKSSSKKKPCNDPSTLQDAAVKQLQIFTSSKIVKRLYYLASRRKSRILSINIQSKESSNIWAKDTQLHRQLEWEFKVILYWIIVLGKLNGSSQNFKVYLKNYILKLTIKFNCGVQKSVEGNKLRIPILLPPPLCISSA